MINIHDQISQDQTTTKKSQQRRLQNTKNDIERNTSTKGIKIVLDIHTFIVIIIIIIVIIVFIIIIIISIIIINITIINIIIINIIIIIILTTLTITLSRRHCY